MKILIIAPQQIPVPPIRGGSVENSIYQISRKLSSNHPVSVTIFSRRYPNYKHHQKENNLTINRVPTGSNEQYLFSIIRGMEGKNYDIIQIDNRPKFIPIIKKHFPNSLISIFLHSLTFVSNRASRHETSHFLNQADLIITNSRSLRKELKQLYPSQVRKIKYIHLGANLNRFRMPSKFEKQHIRQANRLSDTFNIVYAGRLTPAKGIPILMRAVQKVQKYIPEATLIIAGGTSNKAYVRSLKQLAKRLRIRTVFLGYVENKSMHEVYWLGDCLVCPSQSHEAFGLVNIEAMASGLPCIASMNGGIPEIIKHRHNGLLVKRYEDPSSFSKAILQIYKDKKLAHRLIKHAKHEVHSNFKWDNAAAKLYYIYKKAGKSHS